MNEEEGSIVLEATLLLPLFLGFVLALNAILQLAKTEIALQTAVNDTVKEISAQMYPAEIVYLAGREKLQDSRVGRIYAQVSDTINKAHVKLGEAETFVEDYAQWIPSPIPEMIEAEKEARTDFEESGKEWVYSKTNSVVLAAFKKILMMNANASSLKPDRLQVVQAEVPQLGNHEHSVISIEAAYDVTLPIPYLLKKIKVTAKAYERAWVGN